MNLIFLVAEGEANGWAPVIGGAIGVLGTIVVGYFVNVSGKKIDANNNLKDHKIESLKKEKMELQDQLTQLKKYTQDLKKGFEEQQILTSKKEAVCAEIKNKYNLFKITFGLTLNRYELDFADTPEQLNMLRDLRDIIED